MAFIQIAGHMNETHEVGRMTSRRQYTSTKRKI
jgi:hypothetical protein